MALVTPAPYGAHVTTTHLIGLSEKAYHRLRTRLDGLSDEEYLWEPAPLAWSVRDTPAGVRFDFGLMPVEPAPITTIAWRLTHIIDLLREDRCPRVLGVEPEADVDEVWITTSAVEALSLLERSFATWRGYLEATDPEHLLDASEGWTDRFTFALHIIDELIHHAAEVGLLRDLYRAAAHDRRRPRRGPSRATRRASTTSAQAAGGRRRPRVRREVGRRRAADRPRLRGEPRGCRRVTAAPRLGSAASTSCARSSSIGARTDAIDSVYKVSPLVWAQAMSSRMGGPNALGSDYDAVIGYLDSVSGG